MFRKNESYKQLDIFSSERRLSKKQKKMWESSVEHKFFESVFQNIDEQSFAILYSKTNSRPNVPINQLVGSLILKHLNNWTYNELFKQLSFNLLTRHAIGIQTIDEDIFAEASIFNFQNRMISHYVATGVDLVAKTFEQLTAQQLKELGVDTSIQRGDSFLIGSNIIDYSRLHLYVEVLIRLRRILTEKDKELYHELIKYTSQSAGQYLFKMTKEAVPHEVNALAQIYHRLYSELKDSYKEEKIFKIFERVYHDHFVVQQGEISIKPAKELTSDILMSPDDLEATFRRKGKVTSAGYKGHISETAHPGNKVNLITDVVVRTNNTDDGKILEERLPKMIETTPELEEYFADGLYGSEAIDLITKEHEIIQYQTGVRGRKSPSEIVIERNEQGDVHVSCAGGQRVKAEKTKNWKAEFNLDICRNCPVQSKCALKEVGGKRTPGRRIRYFGEKEILAHKRINNIKSVPKEKKNIRANVEATVKEMKRGMKNEKVRIRGLIRVSMHMHFTAIGINITRILKNWLQNFKLCVMKIHSYCRSGKYKMQFKI